MPFIEPPDGSTEDEIKQSSSHGVASSVDCIQFAVRLGATQQSGAMGMALNQPLLAVWSETGLVTIQKRIKLLTFSAAVPSVSPTIFTARLAQLIPTSKLLGCLLAGALLSLSVSHAQAAPSTDRATVLEKGFASYYSRFYQGRRTSSGTRYDPKKLTAAHPWLPLGTTPEGDGKQRPFRGGGGDRPHVSRPPDHRSLAPGGTETRDSPPRHRPSLAQPPLSGPRTAGKPPSTPPQNRSTDGPALPTSTAQTRR